MILSVERKMVSGSSGDGSEKIPQCSWWVEQFCYVQTVAAAAAAVVVVINRTRSSSCIGGGGWWCVHCIKTYTNNGWWC
jgi:hypothetical protein